MRRFAIVAALLLSATWVQSRSNIPIASSADTNCEIHPTLPATDTEAADLAAKIETLRRGGPESLQQLLAQYDRLKAKQSQRRQSLKTAEQRELAELEQIIDLVGGQKHCTTSRLFWFTDLDTAKIAATKTGKPILSLRLLGKLTDELSCANSRFFRMTLYSNPEISSFLRDNFVLHWTSFAPAPRITIDFGDGRQIVRTITGNSMHCVLTADGNVVDALPGLYGPQAFLKHLKTAHEVADVMNAQLPSARHSTLVEYHERRLRDLAVAWRVDLLKTDDARRSDLDGLAVTDTVQEMQRQLAELQGSDHLDFWQRLAELHRADAQLDPASIARIQAMQPQAAAAGRLAMSKAVVERPLLKMVRNLIDNIALDTVRNEYALHSKIHAWLTAGPVDFEPFNDRVYAELFLMPRTDPWLGLAPPDVFAALPNGGLVTPSQQVSNR